MLDMKTCNIWLLFFPLKIAYSEPGSYVSQRCKMHYMAKDDPELLILNVPSAGIIDMSHLPVYAEL